jgi:4'-phosphopantetheinyl transferase
LPDRDLQIVVADLSGNWVLEPQVPMLLASEIHVWEFPLMISESAFANFEKLLSHDERTRASRFHFENDARRFAVARASVRSVLAGYTLSPARDLRFVYSQHGKPSLATPAPDVRFSVSHSGDFALLAVALGREVGVDIEAIREDVETDKLAERFFSVRERHCFRTLPPKKRVLAFFRCWTCKEAFLKAQGIGLSRSLGSFDVDLNPDQPAHLVSTRPDPSEADRWSLHEVEPPAGYAAAAAVEGSITAMSILHCRQA